MSRTSLLALALLAGGLSAQESRPIRAGEPVAATLASDSRHAYTIELDDSTFVLGLVDQISVDAVVTVTAPEGDTETRVDVSSRGPDWFQFDAETGGTYTIVVTPFEEAEGDYEVRLLRVEPVATDPEDRVDQLMAAFSGDDTPGVVVGVVDRGEVVFQRAYGMANLEHGVPFRVDTPTNIGSVTKQFTAMAILLLQNDGLLSLDDDVREHIPELPDFGTPVTLRNLLNHTGGFREIYNFLPMAGRGMEDAIDRDEAIRIVQRQPELQAAPNTEWNYNNTGYILLATVVERVSGKGYDEFLKTRVFEPLGMTRTLVKTDQGQIIPGVSQGYVRAEDGGYRSARDLAASYGAGGIYTTLPDMVRWMLNYRDATVGGAEAIRAITTRAVLEGGDTTGYGLGLAVGEVGGRTLWTHTGGDTAHRTYFGYFPELDSGVFMSSNNGSFGLGPAQPIARAFFGDRMEPEEAEDAEEEPSPEGVMPEERREAVTGTWMPEGGPGLPVTITLEGGDLYAQFEGQPRFALRPLSDSSAAYVGVDATVTFHFQPDGTVDEATHLTRGVGTPMRRLEDEGPTPEELRARAGRYFSRELDLYVDVRVEDDRLVLHRPHGEPLPLRHGEGDLFTGPFPYASVEFRRAGNGAVTGFTAGNGRTKGVLFERR